MLKLGIFKGVYTFSGICNSKGACKHGSLHVSRERTMGGQCRTRMRPSSSTYKVHLYPRNRSRCRWTAGIGIRIGRRARFNPVRGLQRPAQELYWLSRAVRRAADVPRASSEHTQCKCGYAVSRGHIKRPRSTIDSLVLKGRTSHVLAWNMCVLSLLAVKLSDKKCFANTPKIVL